MSNTLSIPILLLVALLQATFVPQIRVLGGGPDLVLLVVLAWSINAELEEGIVWAFVGGIFVDLLSAVPTGTTVFGLIIVVFFVAGLGRQVYRIGILLLTSLVVGGTLITQILQYIIVTFAGFQVNWLEIIGYVIMPTLVYNLVLILPTYWIISRFQRRFADTGTTLSSKSQL